MTFVNNFEGLISPPVLAFIQGESGDVIIATRLSTSVNSVTMKTSSGEHRYDFNEIGFAIAPASEIANFNGNYNQDGGNWSDVKFRNG